MANFEIDAPRYGISETINNEAKLFSSLKDNLFDEVREHIKHDLKGIALVHLLLE
jgi:hypothetical protein